MKKVTYLSRYLQPDSSSPLPIAANWDESFWLMSSHYKRFRISLICSMNCAFHSLCLMHLGFRIGVLSELPRSSLLSMKGNSNRHRQKYWWRWGSHLLKYLSSLLFKLHSETYCNSFQNVFEKVYAHITVLLCSVAVYSFQAPALLKWLRYN